jgi:large subunit ribosomal protein L32e
MKFLRRTSNRYSKLGKRRKKKQVWRRPTGRDNKMRERRRGYPARVSIGYKKADKEKAIVISNPKELENINKKSIIVVGNVGKMKKIEITKKAKEMKLELSNLNINSFLNKNKIKKKEKKVETKKEDKKKVEEKKSKEDEKQNESK